ncbi:hypothetical protein L7F22_012625 [Adiantum nelumboides]|nr:hypothetical protein [Adiantum nelumboides]
MTICAGYAEARAKERQIENVELSLKDKLLEMDAVTLKVKFEGVEGGIVSSFVKSAKESMHIMEGPDPHASSVVHWSLEYEPLPQKDQTQVPLILNEVFLHYHKKLEQYLMSHDDYLQSCRSLIYWTIPLIYVSFSMFAQQYQSVKKFPLYQ